MTRRGYVLATREDDIAALAAQLESGLGEATPRPLRYHRGASEPGDRPEQEPRGEGAPDGMDILRNRTLIRTPLPGFDPESTSVIRIGRAGDTSGRQPGAFMAGAVSGFGTMAASEAGEPCAAWMPGATLPGCARFSLQRHADTDLMAERRGANTGVL